MDGLLFDKTQKANLPDQYLYQIKMTALRYMKRFKFGFDLMIVVIIWNKFWKYIYET